jgi:hypothetical protein
MDADARRIRELERGFRRDGLPNLIVDLSATEDIFTRGSRSSAGHDGGKRGGSPLLACGPAIGLVVCLASSMTEQSRLEAERTRKEHDMRVMLMIKGDPEAGAAPSEELLAAMGKYNDELQKAGVLLDLAGLLPSAEGRRVQFAEGNRTVIDGPFPESKQLIAGYWILQVPSMDEAVEWAKRAPFEALSRIYPGEYGATGEIEIRRVFEMEDLDASNSGG